MKERGLFIQKFDRNAEMMKNFISDYEHFILKYDSAEKQAFAGSKMTNTQYLTVLKQVSKEEYSPAQTLAIRTHEIHENAIKDYIQN